MAAELEDPVPRHPSKIGIGAWEESGSSTVNWIEDMQFGWYYNWRPDQLRDGPASRRSVPFVPMIWGKKHIDRTPHRGSRELLGFNEPDGTGPTHQSNLSVAKALALWPRLMAHDLRLGSPATTQKNTLGRSTWMASFISGAEAAGYRVDFMAVHYYSRNGKVGDFENWLRQVHATYNRPVWVTEWCHVDWDKPRAITAERNAQFAKEALPMLDTLHFVERHAWFAANPYEIYRAPTNFLDSSMNLTPVGRVFYTALEGCRGSYS